MRTLWILVVLALGCISESDWAPFNRAQKSECEEDQQCASGICRLGTCRASLGEAGLNCTRDASCDENNACLVGPQSRGICYWTGHCNGDRDCDAAESCIGLTYDNGVRVQRCLPRCRVTEDCDTFSDCMTLPMSTLRVCISV